MARYLRYAADTQNLLWAGDGLEKRPGYRLLTTLEGRINGIYFLRDHMVVHAGTRLYRVTADGTAALLSHSLKDAPSKGVIRRQNAVKRTLVEAETCAWQRMTVQREFLFLNDGRWLWLYDGSTAFHAADSATATTFYATVPFTAVAKHPDGSGGDVDPKGANRLSLFRTESFYADETAQYSKFKLSVMNTKVLHDLPPEVQLRDENGRWFCLRSDLVGFENNTREAVEQVILPALSAGMPLSKSDGYVVKVGEGINHLAADGMDNVRITYAVDREAPDLINKATVQGLYGAEGGADVLFLGGSTTDPGIDCFSAAGDFLCFYETSVEQLGSKDHPVTGYCRLKDGRLAVLKNEPGAPSVYFRAHKTAEVGLTQSGEPYLLDVYPSRAGAAVECCLSPSAVATVGNEPCFLTESGLYTVRGVSNELINLDQVEGRSPSIDPALAVADASLARMVRWGRYCLLTLGEEGYLTDGRMREGGYRFLRWRFSHCITALSWDGEDLYLGDGEGHLFCFGESETDGGIPFEAYWHTPLLEAGAGRRMLLRQLQAEVSPGSKGRLIACVYRDRTPLRPQELPLGLWDFGDVDFNSLALDGSAEPRWLRLLRGTVAADALSLRLTLTHGVRLWGLRAVYEKGGMEQ